MEKFIEGIYNKINMNKPKMLQHDRIKLDISNHLKIHKYYYVMSSEINNLSGRWHIFLNENDSKEQNWQNFGKLLGYYFYNEINPKRLSIDREIDFDNQFSNFAYHFCIPTFLLEQIPLDNVESPEKLISIIFNVQEDFAYERLLLHRASK